MRITPWLVRSLLLVTMCASSSHVAAQVNESIKATNPDVKLCVQPFTPYPKKMLRPVVRGITYTFGVNVEVLEPTPLPGSAYYKPRRRHRADKILDWMNENLVGKHDCRWFVGLTKGDISVTKPPHEDWGVLGLGELDGDVAVVSSFRTHKKLKSPHTALRRTVKVVNHEIGHMMGLPHRKAKGCLMNDAEGTVLTTDEETGLLCDHTIEYIEAHKGLVVPRHEEMEWHLIE